MTDLHDLLRPGGEPRGEKGISPLDTQNENMHLRLPARRRATMRPANRHRHPQFLSHATCKLAHQHSFRDVAPCRGPQRQTGCSSQVFVARTRTTLKPQFAK